MLIRVLITVQNLNSLTLKQEFVKIAAKKTRENFGTMVNALTSVQRVNYSMKNTA